MGTTFENEILEIFGTTDLEQLKKISRDVASYNQKKQRNISGRKNSFTEIQAAEMVALYSQGESISDLARKYQVSRQTIYNQLKLEIQRSGKSKGVHSVPERSRGKAENTI